MSDTAIGNNTQYALPLFLTRENKYKVAIPATIVFVTMYLTPNHIHLFEPQFLPMSRLDHAVPFLPWTIWIYMSDIALLFVTYAFLSRLETANKYLWALLGLLTASATVFWLWPTTYPREMFPLPADMDFASHWVFSHLRLTDSPANCAPSLHVSSCYLSALTFRDDDKVKYRIWMVWATLIAVSTLTTKQHYAVDVILGFFVAVAFYWLFMKRMSYRWLPGAQAKR